MNKIIGCPKALWALFVRLWTYIENAMLAAVHLEALKNVEDHHGHRIVCSAICVDGENLILGVRHYDPIMQRGIKLLDELMGEGYTKEKQPTQGFIDNNYKFLDRYEAYNVAMKSGQYNRRPGGCKQRMLFSEDYC